MAPKRLQKNISYLDVLAKAKPSQRKAILQTADKDLILCLCECILNVLNGNVPLKPDIQEKLGKYKAQLRILASKETPAKYRKDILVQKGGAFLPLLLAPILGIAGQLIADSITKK